MNSDIHKTVSICQYWCHELINNDHDHANLHTHVQRIENCTQHGAIARVIDLIYQASDIIFTKLTKQSPLPQMAG